MELAVLIPNVEKLNYVEEWYNLSPKGRVQSLFDLINNRNRQMVVKALRKSHPDIALTHVYFGNEFCQNLIPRLSHVETAFTQTMEKGLKFCLVTPYSTIEGINRLKPLLNYLDQQDQKSDIIVNDIGILRMIHQDYRNLTPVLGRIMDKLDREPRNKTSCDKEVDNRLITKAEKEVIYGVPAYRDFLKKSGVKCVEFDNVASSQLIDFTQLKFKVSVYLPYGFVTTGRVCMIGSLHQPGTKKFSVSGKCRKECRHYHALIYNQGLPKEKKLISKGNAVFATNDAAHMMDVIHFGRKRGVRRFVFQPEIPM